MDEITTEAELTELLGTPLPRVAAEDRPAPDDVARRRPAASPFLRSSLWEPATWQPDAVPSRAQIAQQERPEDSIAELERCHGAAYAEGLYPTT